MTTERIDEITEEIEESKESRIKAKGKIEDIEVKWKKDFEVKSLNGAEKLADKLTKEEKVLGEKEEALETEIEELLEEME